MSQNAWFEYFKEQLQGLTESYEQSGSTSSLLRYALQEERLSTDKYLTWAMTHFQLPQLQSRFFTETSISKEMFAKWATHYPWSEECLPVAEWDGCLIVACLQPPQDFPQNPRCAFVLAHPQNLQVAWIQLKASSSDHESSNSISRSPSEEAPEGIDLAMSSTAAPSHKEGFSFDDLGIEGESERSESLNPEIPEEGSAPQEGLEGLFDGATVVQLQNLGGSLKPEEPLNNDLPPESVAAVEASEPGVFESPVVEEEKPSFNPAAVSNPFEKTIVGGSVTPLVGPGVATKPTVNPVAAGNFALDKIKKKNANLINEKVKKVFTEMKTHFEKSLILTLDDQESQLSVFAWDENFKGMKDTTMRIPLNTPSIFRIVSSTQKPFHGYISLNEINEKFFEDWNQGSIPDHVTITPILIQEKLVGMLMGFAEKSAYNRVSLNFAEKLSTEFTKNLAA